MWICYGSQLLLLQFLDGFLLVPEVQLGAHKDDGGGGTVVSYLWVPLGGEESKDHSGDGIMVKESELRTRASGLQPGTLGRCK